VVAAAAVAAADIARYAGVTVSELLEWCIQPLEGIHPEWLDLAVDAVSSNEQRQYEGQAAMTILPGLIGRHSKYLHLKAEPGGVHLPDAASIVDLLRGFVAAPHSALARRRILRLGCFLKTATPVPNVVPG
jgi:hypothetical protein